MPEKQRTPKVSRNPDMIRGVGKYSRSQMYHKAVDAALIKAIEAVPELKTYLGARFSLKQGMKPHELKQSATLAAASTSLSKHRFHLGLTHHNSPPLLIISNGLASATKAVLWRRCAHIQPKKQERTARTTRTEMTAKKGPMEPISICAVGSISLLPNGCCGCCWEGYNNEVLLLVLVIAIGSYDV
ncbi:hypothetical protein IGI04_028001 [Brassica rapa subsp. trilocularis]|uniref:Large ribosomal subunit protein uL6 N-terminal domain-containing protein n=1 Tax=Brassica rapa subsp. trilocularis TaxID=1813537 RepID=A0ABQ7L3P8_BRACM|nr:hypothetical protein IGI04_028001 [Brassica rapa subsp. trilocularis]